jgi:hypothetical protein
MFISYIFVRVVVKKMINKLFKARENIWLEHVFSSESTRGEMCGKGARHLNEYNFPSKGHMIDGRWLSKYYVEM